MKNTLLMYGTVFCGVIFLMSPVVIHSVTPDDIQQEIAQMTNPVEKRMHEIFQDLLLEKPTKSLHSYCDELSSLIQGDANYDKLYTTLQEVRNLQSPLSIGCRFKKFLDDPSMTPTLRKMWDAAGYRQVAKNISDAVRMQG